MRALASDPRQGILRPDLTSLPVRFKLVGNYFIAYAHQETPLWILAVFHARRHPRVTAAMLRSREALPIRYTSRIMTFALLLLLAAQSITPTFVPADFKVPEIYVSRQGTYKLRPLGPKYAKQDYAAYMSSIEHLQKTFTFSTSWPHAGLSMADAVKDVEGEQQGFDSRRKFTYAVLNMDESRELGCVYISPSNKQGYDATVRMWVTENQYVIGFEDRLYSEVKAWIKSRWPFDKVAFIGREITREEFRKLPNKPKP